MRDNWMMSVKSPTLHASVFFTLFVFVALLTMSIVFKVEVVARGQGKVVPITRVQVVQPEFDGKITAIHVRNGSAVERGQVLIELDTTDALAEVNTIRAEQIRLQIENVRIAVLLTATGNPDMQSTTFRSEVLAQFAPTGLSDHSFFIEQRKLLSAEIDDLQAGLAQIDAQLLANEKSVEITHANIARIEASISIQNERLEVAQGLLDRGTTSRSSFLDTQEAFTALEKEREVYLKELDQKLSQETALEAERRSLITGQRNRLLQRRAEIEAALAKLGEQLTTATRRLNAGQLRSPVDGTVDQLEVFTIGGVAGAGQEILRVVPKDQEFEIEAVFSNTDIGFVENGQQANIKFDAYPSERFGHLEGTVSDVSADAIEITDNVWGYSVRITPSAYELVTGNLTNIIRPGMTGEIDITTDKRRIISYFFAPIMKTIESALGER